MVLVVVVVEVVVILLEVMVAVVYLPEEEWLLWLLGQKLGMTVTATIHHMLHHFLLLLPKMHNLRSQMVWTAGTHTAYTMKKQQVFLIQVMLQNQLV